MISLGWKVYIRAGHHSTKIHTNPNIITSEEANDRVTACKMTQLEYLRRKGGNKTGMRGPCDERNILYCKHGHLSSSGMEAWVLIGGGGCKLLVIKSGLNGQSWSKKKQL